MNVFSVDVQYPGEYAIVRSNGYINNLGGEQIAEECYQLMEKGCRKFILNLDKSTVVNSIGISILIELIERVLESDGKIVFSNLTATIAKTFRIMGLFQYAESFSDESAAVLKI